MHSEDFSFRVAPGIRINFECDRVLAKERSRFQQITLFENPTLGRVLVLDGIVQLSSYDQRVYHEALVGAATRGAGERKRALVLGGGDGGAAAIFLEKGFEQVDVVDMDDRVVAICRVHFPEIFAAIDEGNRTHFHCEDARAYLQRFEGCYDAVVCDFTDYDITNQSQYLYNYAFYINVARTLKSGGGFATHAGTSEAAPKLAGNIVRDASRVFHEVTVNQFALLSFGAANVAVVSGVKP